ncbi:MAG: HAD-IIB family hydrolase [Myxococcales bacterium]|nr:HAD-IIB family hydrolase [Myxococcales bacterium]
MKNVRLLALDVDGTLAIRGNEITDGTRSALRRLRDSGVEVALATGRRYRTTRGAIESLGFDVACVCLGGALVKEADGTTLEAATFEPAGFQAVVTFLQAQGHGVVAQRDAHSEGGADFLIDGALSWRPEMRAYHANNTAFAEWCADLASEPRDDALVLGSFGPEDDMRALARDLETAFPGQLRVTAMPGYVNEGFYCEILPVSTCKWEGLLALGRSRDLTGAAICAAGDQRNDLTMLHGAGVGVAMGNALPEVKEAADWVTGRHDEDGIVDLVERILAAQA